MRAPTQTAASGTARETLGRAAEYAALALFGLALARLVWALVTPLTPLGDWHAPAKTIDTSAIGSFDPFFRKVGAGQLAVSSLGLVLSGTRVDLVSGRGSAIITTPDGVQASFLVGEDVMPGVRLTVVAFDAVTLQQGGRDAQLFIDQSASGRTVTPEILPGAGSQRARLAADIMVVPRTSGSAITGYVLTPKGSGAAFAAAGLQPGDVLVSVDAVPVAGIGDPASIARKLDGGGITAGVERGGQRISLRIGGA